MEYCARGSGSRYKRGTTTEMSGLNQRRGPWQAVLEPVSVTVGANRYPRLSPAMDSSRLTRSRGEASPFQPFPKHRSG